jgi:uncharacterized protein DUF805
MKFRLRDLWTWEGTIDRGAYASIGLIGFAIKHNLDRLVAWSVFHRPWSILDYWRPLRGANGIGTVSHPDFTFLLTLVVMSLPFVWIGVVQTLRRLRSIGVPGWLVVFFFVPYFNLLFFLVLCVLPARPTVDDASSRYGYGSNEMLSNYLPKNALGSATVGIAMTAIIGAGFAALSIGLLSQYGWGLFIGVPFCLGLFSVLVYGYHSPRSYGSCIAISCLSVVVAGALLLALAVEGVFCIAMAVPIVCPLAMIGGTIGYFIQRRTGALAAAPGAYLIVLVIAPLIMGAEAFGPQVPPNYEVRTQMEIAAPPSVVWQRLVTFPTLPPPHEWPFRLGIAFPIRSELHGVGIGAQRECQFSSGQFAEPIVGWEENRRLRFTIAAAPLLMEEWSPWGHISTRHIDEHYFRAHDAEFTLSTLGNGNTLLTGVSRYENRMWPSAYWRLWTDAIVHDIHLRVFRFVKETSEADRSRLPS